MTIEFTVDKKQLDMCDAVRGLAKNIIRPQALTWDREKAGIKLKREALT